MHRGPLHKWRNLTLLAVAELLAMARWLAASAVGPQLAAEWGLNAGQQAWLTLSVQLGFVVGALLSAGFNLADRVDSRHLFAASASVGALLNALIAQAPLGIPEMLGLRVLTGITLAGVYPPSMKLRATWWWEDRGLGVRLLVGALTLGSALPHLFNALPMGLVFSDPGLLTALCLVWGFAVVADSAQFSAAVSELTDPRYVGAALTVHTSLGFMLTLLTIQMIPPLLECHRRLRLMAARSSQDWACRRRALARA